MSKRDGVIDVEFGIVIGAAYILDPSKEIHAIGEASLSSNCVA